MHIRHTLSALCLILAGLTAMGAEPLWRASKQTVFEPSERNPKVLVKSYDSELKFNAEGQETEEIQTPVSGTKMRRTSTYTPEGRLATEEIYTWGGSDWTLYSSKLREYDEQTGLVTISEEYKYEGGEKIPGNCFHRTISRNEQGNVTAVEIAVLYGDTYDPTQCLTMTYGDDGKISAIMEQVLTLGNDMQLVWVLGQRYTDLKWETFNGQIASVESLYSGENRLASGHYINDNGSKPYDNYDIAATYSADGSTVVMSGMYQGIENAVITVENTQESTEDGGIKYSMHTCYADKDGAYPPENYLDLNIIDAWGIEVEASEYYWGEDESDRELMFMQTTKVTYDPTYGYPLEALASEEDQLLTRIVYSDYVDCSTLNGKLSIVNRQLSTDNYYDLMGRRISGPQRGFYIHNGKKYKQ